MSRKLQHIIIAIVVGTTLSSCVTNRKINYLQNPVVGVADYEEADSTLLHADYRLQIGDQVYIRITSPNEEASKIFNSSDLAMTANGAYVDELYSYKIYADSCIDYPYIGTVKIAGLTTREAKNVISDLITEYVPDCDIDVRLTNSYYTFIGQSGNGKYNIPEERINIFQALARTGDLNLSSNRKKIHILRKDPITNKTNIRTFDIRSKDIINSEFYYIQPNDIIYVPSFNGQFFGIQSFSNMLSTVTSSLSFAILIYSLCTRDW